MALPTYNPSVITAVSRVQQNIPTPQYVFGGAGGASGTSYKLFKKSSAHVFSLWRSEVFNIGKNFDVCSISFCVMPEMAANMTIVPVLYFDNEDSNSVGTTINSTNYPNSEKLIKLNAKSFGNSVHGRSNFFLELRFTGSALAVVELPILIDIEVED